MRKSPACRLPRWKWKRGASPSRRSRLVGGSRIPGRKPLPENLPRVEEVLPCALKNCQQCGAETTVIGFDESELLDREPAHYFVRVIKREKRARRCCQTSTVNESEKNGVLLPASVNAYATELHISPMPELQARIVEKGLASDRVLIQTVIAKYLRSSAAVPAGGDSGAGSGFGDQPGDARWMGDEVGELLAPVICGDATGSAKSLLSVGR